MAKKVSKRALQKVLEVAAKTVGVETSAFFVADHHHEGLSPGAYSIALEGHYDWTIKVSAQQWEGATPEGVFLEPVNGWCLAVYPA